MEFVLSDLNTSPIVAAATEEAGATKARAKRVNVDARKKNFVLIAVAMIVLSIQTHASTGLMIENIRFPATAPIDDDIYLIFTITNKDASSFKYKDSIGFTVFSRVSMNGKSLAECGEENQYGYTWSDKGMDKGWRSPSGLMIKCTGHAGSMQVELFLAPSLNEPAPPDGKHLASEPRSKIDYSRAIKQATIHINLIQPTTSVDITAHQYLASRGSLGYVPEEFVKQFPGSYYAGRTMIFNICGVEKNLFFDAINEKIEHPERQMECGIYSDYNKRDQQCRERLNRYAVYYEQFIRSKPDYYMLPEVRAQYAYILIAIDRLNEALEQIAIVKSVPGRYSDNARESLDSYYRYVNETRKGVRFVASIVAYPREIPIGATIPLRVSLSNVSGEKISRKRVSSTYANLSYSWLEGGGKCDKVSFDFYGSRIRIERDGTEEYFLPGWRGLNRIDSHCDTSRPGLLSLVIDKNSMQIRTLATRGEYFQYSSLQDKLLKSDSILIRITDPTGVDRLAYDYFHGDIRQLNSPSNINMLADKFPKSTYYAQAFYNSRFGAYGDEFYAWDQLRTIQDGSFLRCMSSYIDANGKWVRFDATQSAAWTLKNIDTILYNQPTIWMKNELRFLKAIYLAAAHNYDSADAEFNWVEKNGPSYLSEKAEEYRKIIHDPKWLGQVDKHPAFCID